MSKQNSKRAQAQTQLGSPEQSSAAFNMNNIQQISVFNNSSKHGRDSLLYKSPPKPMLSPLAQRSTHYNNQGGFLAKQHQLNQDDQQLKLPSLNTTHLNVGSAIPSYRAKSTSSRQNFLTRRSSSLELAEEFTEYVRKKYHLPEHEEFMKMDYKERNKHLYDILKNYKICVVPSSKIESFDKLPHFLIIETSLRDIKKMPRKGKSGAPVSKTHEKNKLTRFDPRNVKGNIELFQHINDIQSLKYRKMFDQSDSLQVKKKKKAGKYAGIVEDFGIKVVDEEEEEYMRESPKLLGQVPSDLPDAFKNADSRMYQINLISDDNYDTIDSKDSRRQDNKPLSLVEKRKQEDHAKNFKHKVLEALSRKFRLLAENEILMKSYLEEKRKLEYQIVRDNRKNEATQSMINTMYGQMNTEKITAKPKYRFEALQAKYPQILGNKNVITDIKWRPSQLIDNAKKASSGLGQGMSKSGSKPSTTLLMNGGMDDEIEPTREQLDYETQGIIFFENNGKKPRQKGSNSNVNAVIRQGSGVVSIIK